MATKEKKQVSLEAGLWNACNKLRGSETATDYVNVVLGFLNVQTAAVTEYTEPLARRLIEKITIFDEKMVVRFKCGLRHQLRDYRKMVSF